MASPYEGRQRKYVENAQHNIDMIRLEIEGNYTSLEDVDAEIAVVLLERAYRYLGLAAHVLFGSFSDPEEEEADAAHR